LHLLSGVVAKRLIGSKKLVGRGGAKMAQTSSITMPSMVGILNHALAIDEKGVMFLSVFLSHFGMTKFVITEML